jgi:hypothetical protein
MTAKKPVTKAVGKPGARLTPKQWAEAEALWESGEVTLEDLAAKFGKHKSNFSRHFDKLSIKRGSKAEAHKREVAKAVTAAAIDEVSVTAARIRETKEDHYKMAAGLGKLVWSEILTAKQGGNPVSVATANLKALDIAATTLKKVREERWAVLGLDKADFIDEDGLPELTIMELTAEQLEALRNRDEADLGLSVGAAVQTPEELDDDNEGDENEVVETS